MIRILKRQKTQKLEFFAVCVFAICILPQQSTVTENLPDYLFGHFKKTSEKFAAFT